VLQQKLGFELCSPADNLLLQVPARFLQRQVGQGTLADALTRLPAFVKPVTPKQFRGAVYKSADELSKECRGLPPDTGVLVAEPVTLTAEIRSFVFAGRVLDAALYEGTADLSDAIKFVSELSNALELPRSVVVDVGFVFDRGWAVIEFNAAWGAGLNGCSPEEIIPAILAASGPSVD
jgi:hypothetical protein